MIVLLDCHGVLADLHLAVCELLGVPEHDVSRWGFTCTGRTRADIDNALDKALRAPDTVHTYPGAVAAVRGMRRAGHVVHCVSAYHSRDWANWLMERFAFTRTQIHQTYSKEFIPGDVLIDDHPPTVRRWATSVYRSGEVRYFVLRRAYNEGWIPRLPRLDDLEVQSLARGFRDWND
jgi:hypothetical protein